jgi:hypothetical protein
VAARAGELVDLKIRAYMARHRCGYVEAYQAVLAEGGPEVEAYARREPGLAERVREFEVERSRLAGEVLNQRAKAIQRQTGERDYRKAFAAACRASPEVAKSYGVKVEPRPAQIPWWRQPAPTWRRRSA